VLKALADNCLKATFFEIGEHAVWHPEIAKQVAAAGHTIGSHTCSHKDLAKKLYASDIEQAKQEIEMEISALHAAVAGPISSFFRFPDLQHPPALLSYLAERNIAIFSTGIDSFDFKMRKPEQVIDSVMRKLGKQGKGIILMHDFQHPTAQALLRHLLAAEMIERALAAGVPFRWVAADGVYGVGDIERDCSRAFRFAAVILVVGMHVPNPARRSVNEQNFAVVQRRDGDLSKLPVGRAATGVELHFTFTEPVDGTR
jgi:Polysaccharide deacetylase